MGCDFQMLSLADLKQQTVGASGKRVREVWDRARKHQPRLSSSTSAKGFSAGAAQLKPMRLPLTSSTHFSPSGTASAGMRRSG